MNNHKDRANVLLIIANLAGYIITIWQFFVNKDYSAGTIVGILSMALSAYLYVIENLPRLIATTAKKYDFRHIKSNFILLCIVYCVSCIFIFFLCNVFESAYLGAFNLFGMPLILSVFMLFVRIFHVDIGINYWMVYKKICPLPNIIFIFIVFIGAETIFSKIVCLLGSLIMYLIVFLLVEKVYHLCTKHYSE